jgi:hypothetical protein
MAGVRCLRLPQGAAMTVLVEPFASVYDDRSRLGVILARLGLSINGIAALFDHLVGAGEQRRAFCFNHRP